MAHAPGIRRIRHAGLLRHYYGEVADWLNSKKYRLPPVARPHDTIFKGHWADLPLVPKIGRYSVGRKMEIETNDKVRRLTKRRQARKAKLQAKTQF
jgi:hypothetical protein